MSFSAFGRIGGTRTVIEDQVLGAPAANITFAAIAGTYRHLMIEILAKEDAANTREINIEFNATGTTYHNQIHYSEDGVAHGVPETASNAAVGVALGADAPTADSFGWSSILIPEYANDKVKFAFGVGHDGRTTTYTSIENRLSKWDSAAAITQVKLTPALGSFIADTRAILIGIS